MTATSYTFDSNIVSDLFKDAYGYRPREGFWQRWQEATDAERQEEWNWLLQVLERRVEEDRRLTETAIQAFESRVAAAVELGAESREVALRWIMDADDCVGDEDMLCYRNGLPFSYFSNAV